MAGTKISIESFLADPPALILTNIGKELTGESLIGLYQLISGNIEYVASNLGRGQHRNLAFTMTAEDYLSQTSYAFVTLHNPGN